MWAPVRFVTDRRSASRASTPRAIYPHASHATSVVTTSAPSLALGRRHDAARTRSSRRRRIRRRTSCRARVHRRVPARASRRRRSLAHAQSIRTHRVTRAERARARVGSEDRCHSRGFVDEDATRRRAASMSNSRAPCETGRACVGGFTVAIDRIVRSTSTGGGASGGGIGETRAETRETFARFRRDERVDGERVGIDGGGARRRRSRR